MAKAKKQGELDALMSLFRTSDRMQHRVAQEAARLGLTGSQFNVLHILRSEGGPLPCLKIAQRMITVVPGITGLLDRLEDKNLVRRDRSTEDRRQVNISLTSTGTSVMSKLEGPISEIRKALFAGFSDAEISELHRLMEKVRMNMEPEGEDEEA
jgi:DNA-binding MarR family transcriptional regulator